ncbi:ABC-type sugar transport system permease subunit [Ereboglobus sp. PH5-10]|uniref:hypothetical protein n=1 Tax=Ereboglobus sp. PH5-10 TaxID=2940629 RepID=UPI002404AFB1|nr:hypothetical protein [Ereboglobus sp. PH5-10]MDF9827755.1 ABC-type sugar transport system permease subunit [Ereboglobus sp. PH5-10]
MKRISFKARKPTFATIFLFTFVSAVGAVFFTFLILLPFAEIDPSLTPLTIIGGILLMIIVWPLIVTVWFSFGGVLIFALIGKKWRLRYTFIVDDETAIQEEKETN